MATGSDMDVCFEILKRYYAITEDEWTKRLASQDPFVDLETSAILLMAKWMWVNKDLSRNKVDMTMVTMNIDRFFDNTTTNPLQFFKWLQKNCMVLTPHESGRAQ